MLIQVKPQHIERGEVSNCEACPVALAVTEAVGIDATAGYEEIQIGILRCDTPENVRDFMITFDDRYAVKPISFEIPWDLEDLQ